MRCCLKNGDADVANLRFKGYNKYDGRTETENIHCTEKTIQTQKLKTAKAHPYRNCGGGHDRCVLTLLNIEKQIDADSASSAQESETTATTAYAVAVNDIAEPEKIALISGNVTTADSVKLPDEIKQLLLDYTSDKYEYAGELKYSSLSQYFNTDSTYGRLYAGFCNTSLQYLIYARQCRSADLSYDEASFVINVESATVKKGVYTINYTISEKVAFAICDSPAESCGMEVEAQISKGTDGKYKFDILADDTDVNLLIEERVMSYLGYDYEEYYLKDMKIPDNLDYDKMYSGILKSSRQKRKAT